METSKDGSNTENTLATKTEQIFREKTYTLETTDALDNVQILTGLTVDEICAMYPMHEKEIRKIAEEETKKLEFKEMEEYIETLQPDYCAELKAVSPEQKEQLLHGNWTKAQAEEGPYYDENGKLRERKKNS